jgi:FAD/FMN-containing dehydrogenase
MEIKKIQIDLAKKIQGSILDPGDQGYTDTITIDNSRVTHEPYLVAVPATSADVGEIIKYCKQQAVPLTTKSGGHSAAGYCLNSQGVVLDMVNISNISAINAGRGLSIGAGTRWIRAYNFLKDRQSEYTVIGGGCAGVGVAGFILGGGYSFISRSYGLGSDNVTGMEFVRTKRTCIGHCGEPVVAILEW